MSRKNEKKLEKYLIEKLKEVDHDCFQRLEMNSKLAYTGENFNL
jgi:hypothetical protein